ncbi:MinD/ParA family protein [Paenibacillus motobuensis]|uniref:MinD/ParA family protein n=1 Tax=Paenibacillus TaxID=44249 RepID=UPI00203F6DAE|nr:MULTISPECIES: MinD/ParA family protein [Paenibacillus]MCM3038269.1 MinD/ParA family protein [Paenibacillus lutimineralis]MCM3645373.1 MinD/ParA family protein [Paenibacillus motobuensis]
MSDQAQALRQLVSSYRGLAEGSSKQRTARVLTVSSGKGGVGKSNFTLNFALALKSLGRKVLVFDADIGMANIDVLMGARPKYNLYHLLRGERKMSEIVELGTLGLPFIAGGSGLADLFLLSEADLNYFTSQIEIVAEEMDFIIFDTGAGLSKETLKFITAADECMVVTTPEPTSITDAYALIKVVHGLDDQVNFRLVVNRVTGESEARQVADKISLVSRRFLELEIPMLGYLRDDTHVMQAVKGQTPFITAFPASAAARDIQRLAMTYLNVPQNKPDDTLSGIKGFMHRWLRRDK